jgi:hypothetical protein
MDGMISTLISQTNPLPLLKAINIVADSLEEFFMFALKHYE